MFYLNLKLLGLRLNVLFVKGGGLLMIVFNILLLLKTVCINRSHVVIKGPTGSVNSVYYPHYALLQIMAASQNSQIFRLALMVQTRPFKAGLTVFCPCRCEMRRWKSWTTTCWMLLFLWQEAVRTLMAKSTFCFSHTSHAEISTTSHLSQTQHILHRSVSSNSMCSTYFDFLCPFLYCLCCVNSDLT